MRGLAHARVLPSPLVSPYYYHIHIQPRPTTTLPETQSNTTGSLERAQYSILPLSSLRRTVNTRLICAQINATTFAPGNAAVSPTLWYCLSRPIHSSTSGDSQFTAATTSSRSNIIASPHRVQCFTPPRTPARLYWETLACRTQQQQRPHHRLTQLRDRMLNFFFNDLSS